METIFPEGTGYEGFFAVGVRKDPGNPTMTQRVGTAILKRTYDINPATGRLTPSDEPFPVFMQDQPDNLAINSDFGTALFDDDGNPIDWVPEDGAVIRREPDNDDSVPHSLRVSGSANSRVVQTLSFEERLGGRTFTLSFSAGKVPTEVNAVSINNVRLEADGESGTVVICDIDRTLATSMTRYSATGTWPQNLEATEMFVVLRAATNAARVVFYDEVQVEERAYLTEWNLATSLLYEHDLAAFKPKGDVIVLGFTDETGNITVAVDGVVWLTRNLASASPRVKALLGWEPRAIGDRFDDSGTFPEEADAYPLEDPLPSDFNNRFYNGYRRTSVGEGITQSVPESYLPADAEVVIERPSTSDYAVTLNEELVTASYYFFGGTGDDEEADWHRVPFTMNLDTLVIEPENDQCYAVWRGVWPYDDHPEDRYRKLVVNTSG